MDKKIEIFSKKSNGVINLAFADGYSANFSDQILKASWLDNGWNDNNSSDWLNEGWNNFSTNWVNSGWNNYSGSWMNNGWTNSGDDWVNDGWSNDSGCFLTTACVQHEGLSDDCDELTILRIFRDKLVENDPEFRKSVLEYYKNAPRILEKIEQSIDKDKILNDLYINLVLPCVRLLKENKMQEAKEHYTNEYLKLARKYIPNNK